MKSYRQLPTIVYHFQTKFRDEPRSRGGLIRVREFVMKDSYTLDADEAGLDHGYQLHYEAYEKIFARLGLHTVVVGADVGIMGGSLAHEFMVLNEHGEDTLVICDACGYAANQQIATITWPDPAAEELLPTEEVATPEADTIAALAEQLGVGTDKTAKATFFVTGDGRLITAIVRGDFEVNETKLSNAVKAIGGLRPAHTEEIQAAGMEPGYASPIGAHDTVVVIDALAARSPNLVAGGNHHGYHLLNVNHGRDFSADLVVDIANAREGDPCPQCGERLHLSHGIEVGNIFKLGTDFTKALGGDVPGRGRLPPAGDHGLVRDRPGAQRGLHRGGAPRRQGHHLASRGRALPCPPGRPGRAQGPGRGRSSRRALPAPGRCRGGRPVRRPRRVTGREADRCRADGHAHHPDHLHPIAGSGRGGGHRSGQR